VDKSGGTPASHPIPAALHFLTFGVFYRNKADESERRNLLFDWVTCSSECSFNQP